MIIDKCYYEGIWKNGKPDGKGDVKDNKDNFFSGVFKDGIPILKHKIDKVFLQTLCSFKL